MIYFIQLYIMNGTLTLDCRDYYLFFVFVLCGPTVLPSTHKSKQVRKSELGFRG